jgi:hypothetical protein
MDGDRASEYRRKAKECRTMAAKAPDHVTRAEWMVMAQGWDVLAHHAEEDEKLG